MKTCVIYHRVDLDGWMSAAIVLKQFIEKQGNDNYILDGTAHVAGGNPHTMSSMDFLGFQYGDELPDLSKYNRVIMVDISFPTAKMFDLFNRLGDDLIWIDHHISAMNEIDGLTGELNVPTVEGLRRTDMAACELTWKYYYPYFKSDNPSEFAGMPEIVRLLGRYDCFGHKGTDEERRVLEFQYGARQVISNHKQAYNFLINSLEDRTIVPEIRSRGKIIYSFLCTQAVSIWKDAFPIALYETVDGKEVLRKFACVNENRFNPINFGIDYHSQDYEGVACFWYTNKKWGFSLYNDNGKVDCSVIAKSLGGGGHKGAAGFVIDKLEKIFFHE